MNTLELLAKRRSVKFIDMQGEGPTPEQLETILRAGMRVPDHGKLAPWRFIVMEGQARRRFGEACAEFYAADNPDAAPSSIEFERARFERAPTVVAVLSLPKMGKIPLWEQQLSAGAACQNMLVAASAMGLASQWLSEWVAFDDRVKALLDCGPDDQVAGYLYFGGKASEPSDRPRPEFDEIVRKY